MPVSFSLDHISSLVKQSEELFLPLSLILLATPLSVCQGSSSVTSHHLHLTLFPLWLFSTFLSSKPKARKKLHLRCSAFTIPSHFSATTTQFLPLLPLWLFSVINLPLSQRGRCLFHSSDALDHTHSPDTNP